MLPCSVIYVDIERVIPYSRDNLCLIVAAVYKAKVCKMFTEALETIWWLQGYTTPVFFTLVAVAWVFKEVTMGVCNSKKRLDGKVAIVTGW